MSQDKIDKLCQEANSLIEELKYAKAEELLQQAWDLIPKPREEQYASTWIKTTIGDIHFLSDSYDSALEYFKYAYKCNEGFANPFINLRLGQCYFNLKQIDKAKEYLQRAYMLEGEDIFSNEPKFYFNLVDK